MKDATGSALSLQWRHRVANPKRNEVSKKILGKTRIFKLNLSATKKIEADTGIDYFEIPNNLSMTVMQSILSRALEAGSGLDYDDAVDELDRWSDTVSQTEMIELSGKIVEIAASETQATAGNSEPPEKA